MSAHKEAAPLPGQVVEVAEALGLAPARQYGAPDLQAVDRLVREQQRLCDFLTSWAAQQNALLKEQAAKNDQLVSALMDMHKQSALNLQRVEQRGGPSQAEACQTGAAPTPAACGEPGGAEAAADTRRRQTADLEHVVSNLEGSQQAEDGSAAAKVADDLEALEKDEVMLDAWRRSSGLHTVDQWVRNYRKHPGAWGALLMIHGVQEVTGRLRTKVENYAIYSALFLSMSIALMVDAPTALTQANPNDEWSALWWMTEVRRRVYFYGLAVGTGSHMLSILLGMAFVNALNETARDSDVYRLFSRGKGYLATVKCQYTFRIGCVGDYIAMAVAATAYIHWAEVLIIGVAMLCITGRILIKTSNLLYTSGSIVKYWRTELGGHPDENDPYDLSIPMKCLEQRSHANKSIFRPDTGLLGAGPNLETSGAQSELFQQVRSDSPEKEAKAEAKAKATSGGSEKGKKVGIAAIF